MGTVTKSSSGSDITLEESVDDEAKADSGETTDAAKPTRLPLDQVFEILKNERRRTVLAYLRDNEGPIALGNLAEHVAAVENDKPVAQVTSNERKCVYVGLYQCHLPKMDNMDIVEFNQNRGRIEIGPNADQLEKYRKTTAEDTRPWPLYYLGASSAGFVLAMVAFVGAGPVAAVGLSTATIVSVATLATVQYRRSG